MEQERLTLGELQSAANSLGVKRTEKALEILSENEVFVQAWKTNVGKEVLNYLVTRFEKALVILYRNEDENICRECRVEIKLIESYINEIARKVNAYVGTIERVRNKATGRVEYGKR